MSAKEDAGDLEHIRAARKAVIRRGYDMRGIVEQLETIEQALEDDLVAAGAIPPPRSGRHELPRFTVTARRAPTTTGTALTVEVRARSWTQATVRGVRSDERHLLGHRFTATVHRTDHGHEARSFAVHQPSDAPTTVQRLDAAPAADDDTCLVCHGRTPRMLAQACQACDTHAEGPDGPDYTDADTRSQLERPNDLHYAGPPAKTPLCGRTLTLSGERMRTTPTLSRVTCTKCIGHRDFPTQVS